MEETEKLKAIIAENITKYRKYHHLTQLDLSEKLNYSDKSISKWERAEGIPDVLVLLKLSEIFNCTINDLIKPQKKHLSFKKTSSLSLIIALIIVWFVAVLVFSIFILAKVDISKKYLCFIYAIPISSLLIFLRTIKNQYLLSSLIWSSLTLWSIALSLRLSLPLENAYLFFIIALPIELLIITITLWKKYHL